MWAKHHRAAKQKVYSDSHYKSHKADYVGRALARQDRLYEEILVPAKDKPCADCGNKFPTVCMDFDHVRGIKKFSVSTGYTRYSVQAVLDEMAKCEVVCACCHRIRTAKRFHVPLVK